MPAFGKDIVNPGEAVTPLNRARLEILTLGPDTVRHYAAPVAGGRVDVLPELAHPEDFHGNPHVHHLVAMGGAFEPLIGTFEDKYGFWDNPERMAEQGIVVLAHHYDEAKVLEAEINKAAGRVISNPALYNDPAFGEEFYNLAKDGYALLTQHEQEFGLAGVRGDVVVSLERAGLVTSRLSQGLPKDALIENEVRVVTKRTHLKGEPQTHLTATVEWRDWEKAKQLLQDAYVDIGDFVNPASGASTLAFVIAAERRGVLPRALFNRSMSLTPQGTLFVQNRLAGKGILSTYYSLGDCPTLNEAYYLIGKPVGDAGHILRHALPSWYQQ